MLKNNESMGNKNNIKCRKRNYRNVNHKEFNSCMARRLFGLITIYLHVLVMSCTGFRQNPHSIDA